MLLFDKVLNRQLPQPGNRWHNVRKKPIKRGRFKTFFTQSDCHVCVRCGDTLVDFITWIFVFFSDAEICICFYGAVRTCRHFEVRCSSLSLQLVLESPTGETYGVAWQPETIGRRRKGGREEKRRYFSLSRVLLLSVNRLEPERTVCGHAVEKPLWIIRAFPWIKTGVS